MGDVFYNPPQRFLGYGLAIGEALSYQFDDAVVQACKAVCILYIAFHIIYVAINIGTLPAVMEAALFQLVASAIIPTAINYYLCKHTASFFYDVDILPSTVRGWMPVLIGILVIPVYFAYLDPFVIDNIKRYITNAM